MTSLSCAKMCSAHTDFGILYSDSDTTLALYPMDSGVITFMCRVKAIPPVVEVLLKVDGNRSENIVFHKSGTSHMILHLDDDKPAILRNISTAQYGINLNPKTMVGPVSMQISITYEREQVNKAYKLNITNKPWLSLREDCKCTGDTGSQLSTKCYVSLIGCLIWSWLLPSSY
ncbi:uncharacterized protein [Ptychodera flava]|uniref:uncharacterized protein n=1 Tax=Ptychodera flava TaxID=63121 RepID=UPI00396A20A1